MGDFATEWDEQGVEQTLWMRLVAWSSAHTRARGTAAVQEVAVGESPTWSPHVAHAGLATRARGLSGFLWERIGS